PPRFTRQSDEIETGIARDFTGENNQIALGQSLAGYAALRILFQTGIEDVIANRIADFIWVALGDGLGRKDMARHGNEGDLLSVKTSNRIAGARSCRRFQQCNFYTVLTSRRDILTNHDM